MGNQRFRILEALGRGSYSTVWRAETLDPLDGASLPVGEHADDWGVALKDVLCRSKEELHQSLFEVELLLALEQSMLLDGSNQQEQLLRFPRCIAYKVDPCVEGWRVRTVMARLPGEQLDMWIRRTATAPTGIRGDVRTWTSAIRGGCAMAERLVRQIAPILDRLAPMAWHRDVNSHNLLVSDVVTGDCLAPRLEQMASTVSFWLIDFGLAVDSRTWVSTTPAHKSEWCHAHISGDCRYWPVSSWMMHVFGAEYLEQRPDFLNQYHARLDIHGLGITAVELICAPALAARSAGAPRGEDPDKGRCWDELLNAWQTYHDTVEHWSSKIYRVFREGGDFRPVHNWLVRENAVDQVIALMAELQRSLRACLGAVGSSSTTDRVLQVVAELIDETSRLQLADLPALLEPVGTPDSIESRSEVGSAGSSCAQAVPAEHIVQGMAHLAACVAAEGRRTLNSLAPIPAVVHAPPECPEDVESFKVPPSRQAEMADLREAQAQLRMDLEKLQNVKMRLQQAKKVHEELSQATSTPPERQNSQGVLGGRPDVVEVSHETAWF